MEHISDIKQIDDIFGRYFKKGTITNSYLLEDSFKSLISKGHLHCTFGINNCCLLMKESEFFQLHYFINDLKENLNIDTDFPVVIEILYRGESQKPVDVFNFWLNNNFERYLTRDNYSLSYVKRDSEQVLLPQLKIKAADTESEIKFCYELIKTTFDLFTGDIPGLDEIEKDAMGEKILCAYSDGTLSGVLRHELKNNTAWLNHIAVKSEFRGKGISSALVNAFISYYYNTGNSRFMLWVEQNNFKAISLYTKFGFIYSNKSSASFLRY